MSSQPNNNPMINILRDGRNHARLFSKFEIEINFALGFCKSCKEKNYLRKEPNCLSGGRYCVINSEFRTCEPVLETLRMICLRNNYGVDKLIEYMILQRDTYYELTENRMFKEKDFPIYSFDNMQKVGADVENIKKCVNDSFVPRKPGEEVDFDLDNNTLLQ